MKVEWHPAHARTHVSREERMTTLCDIPVRDFIASSSTSSSTIMNPSYCCFRLDPGSNCGRISSSRWIKSDRYPAAPIPLSSSLTKRSITRNSELIILLHSDQTMRRYDVISSTSPSFWTIWTTFSQVPNSCPEHQELKTGRFFSQSQAGAGICGCRSPLCATCRSVSTTL